MTDVINVLDRSIEVHEKLEDSNEDTKGVVRNRISKKDRQYDDNKKKDTQRSTTHKTQDRATRTSLITGGELRCHRMVGSSFSTIVIVLCIIPRKFITIQRIVSETL